MSTENNLYFALMYRHCLLLHANCSAIPMRLITDDQTGETEQEEEKQEEKEKKSVLFKWERLDVLL